MIVRVGIAEELGLHEFERPWFKTLQLHHLREERLYRLLFLFLFHPKLFTELLR